MTDIDPRLHEWLADALVESDIYEDMRSDALLSEDPAELARARDYHDGQLKRSVLKLVHGWLLAGRPSEIEADVRALPHAEAAIVEAGADSETTEEFDHLARVDDPDVALVRSGIRSRLLQTSALNDLPPLEPLVDRYLYRDTLAMLYGPSGSGKTFLAVSWALSIATGAWWERNEVQPAPVLYVAAEGVRMIHQRIEAWSAFHNVRSFDQHDPVHWHPGAVNLFDSAEAEALTDVANELGVGLVVIDTLARCAAGAEENSARDMGRVIEACDRIRNATQACVLLVHHSGKDAANGARGSSVLRAAMDTEVALDASGRLTVSKAKDWAPPPSIHTRLEVIGDSCVITADGRGTADALPRTQTAVLDVLRSIDTGDGVSTATWRDIAVAGEVAEAVSKSSFYTALRNLVESNLVQNIGTERMAVYTLQTQGEAA